MPDGSSAHDYFSQIGSNVNAFTYDVTCYEVYANNKFKENLSYLLKFVYTPYFTKELVNGEKGIITEEIKMIKIILLQKLFMVYSEMFLLKMKDNI